ncbi:hypothetical protein AYO38_08230 [bacterium SCGC AG-212-C10]|nr:hypothetical protein AYO38_08230 [bacterium SCGC AG-212-C10]
MVTLLAKAKGRRLEAALHVAVMPGMRRGEVAGLRWESVDFDGLRLRVAGALQRINGKGLVWAEPKTAESLRYVDVPAELIAALKAHLMRQLEEREKAGETWKDTGYVFTTTIGTPIDPHKLWSEVQEVAKLAELPRKPFHDLRHGYATMQMEVGAPAPVVQRLLGHTRVPTTQDIYQHVTKRLQRESVDRFAQLFATPSEAGLVSALVSDPTADENTISNQDGESTVSATR